MASHTLYSQKFVAKIVIHSKVILQVILTLSLTLVLIVYSLGEDHRTWKLKLKGLNFQK
jgi:hypothetical protein